MSYQWMGTDYAHAHYSDEIERAHTNIKYTASYKDPIWAVLRIYKNGTIKIKGRATTFLPPTPEDLNRPQYNGGYPHVPFISDRTIGKV